ncbi:MAG TPA: tyrosine-type recombinase/integrase, partial [Gemmataceae bacterium]|nr:tyrosine-type recombinase/integrase [Gemmataceae bacterium]
PDVPLPPPRGSRPKPEKPSPDFPLFPHAAGVWAKKIRGKMHYFGPWADPGGALDKYVKEKDALHAGRKPREESDGVTVKELCNRFLNAKQALVDSGELTRRSWDDYKAACALAVSHFGKGRLVSDLDPDDFAGLRKKLARKWGPVTLGNVIQRIRVAFKFAWDGGLIDRPVRYGQSFKRPSRKVVRIDRAQKGPRLFTAEEVRRLADAAGVQMKAMILLGANAGFGNADCGRLPIAAADLDAGVIDFPRPKTGIPRRCVLWPETVAAIRETLAARPTPKNAADAGLVFITKYGLPWAKDTADQTLAKEFGKLLRKLKINGRKGLGFYTLRHTFRTIADAAKDRPAADYIMGHEVPHMSSVYRETIGDDRLRAVAEHVRAWLYPEAVQ